MFDPPTKLEQLYYQLGVKYKYLINKFNQIGLIYLTLQTYRRLSIISGG